MLLEQKTAVIHGAGGAAVDNAVPCGKVVG
jgi:hypothetical protein